MVLLFGNVGRGQETSVQIAEFGLSLFPDKSPKGICKDHRGFIWVGTDYNGLTRFDGTNFESFTEESNGLFNRHIKCIIAMPDSLLLLHYVDHYNNLSGFEFFDPVTHEIFSFVDYMKKRIPFDIFAQDINVIQNLDSSIWFYNKDSVWELKNKTLSGYAKIPDFYTNGDLYKGPRDHYWIVKSSTDLISSNVYYINQQGKIVKEYYYKYPKRTFSACTSGELICTSSRTVYIHDGLSVDTLIFGDTSSQNLRFYVPHQKQIWSISVQKPECIDIYDHRGQLVLSAVVNQPNFRPSMLLHSAIWYWDNNGGLWFQYKDRLGLLQLAPNKFQRYIHRSNAKKIIRRAYPQTANPIRGITKDKYGNLFINSVWTYRRNKSDSVFRRLARLPDRQQALFADQNGHIWTTTFNGRVLEYDPLTEHIQEHFLDRSVAHKKNTIHSMYWSIYRDKKGRVWIGRKGGLSYLDAKTGNQLDFDSDEMKMVFHFYENAQGIWICTSSGLFLMDYDYNIIGHYHRNGKGRNYLSHNIIVHLYEDKDGSFWLASKGGGLLHWDPKLGQQKRYRINTENSDDVFYAVYPDDYNHLWLSSNHGLICFNKKNKEMIIYTEENGISDNEFNTIAHYKDEEGKLYFGSLNGVTAFHPKDLVTRSTDAPLALVSVTKYNNNTQEYSNITAKVLQQKILNILPSDREVKLQFALLNYNNPEQTQYAYKIEGLDKDWTYLKKPEVSLAGLPYGEYTVLLKSKAIGKRWIEIPLEVRIIVHLPFYFSWIFVTSCMLSLLFFVFTILKFRTRILEQQKVKLAELVNSKTATIKEQTKKLKSLDEMKSRFFVNISHELRTPLTLILGPLANLIANKDPSNLEELVQLKLMKRNGNRLLNLVEEILALSRLEGQKIAVEENNVKLSDFCRLIYSMFESSARIANIHFLLDYQVKEDFILKIDRNKAEKVLINLLSNAMKFTPKDGTIEFIVSEDREQIHFMVKDTGGGIPEKDIPYIFDRFYQSSNNEQGGTGVGL
ncbi:MAG: ATP-binding protein, partial [Saprospiraceae bacterium]|nr:ATP-binding protein [Saprospiraceae bacterium]